MNENIARLKELMYEMCKLMYNSYRYVFIFIADADYCLSIIPKTFKIYMLR